MTPEKKIIEEVSIEAEKPRKIEQNTTIDLTAEVRQRVQSIIETRLDRLKSELLREIEHATYRMEIVVQEKEEIKKEEESR